MIAVNVHACPQNHPCTECGACTKVCRVFSRVQDEAPVG